MNRKLLLIPLFAVVVTLPKKASSQEDRKVSIEITTTENGNTTTKSLDLENATDAELQEALRDLGIMDHFSFSGDDGNVVIDIRRFGAGEGEDGFHMRTHPPVPPMPPTPPMAGQNEKHTWLGVSNQKLSEETIKAQKLPVKEGVELIEVIKDSPAEAAGLRKGDVITSFDGSNIADPGVLSEFVRAKKPGDKVKITYYRNGKKNNVTVTLAEREMEFSHFYRYDHDGHGDHSWREDEGYGDFYKKMSEPRAFLGVTPGDRPEGVSGAVIGGVEEGSAAEKMGVQEGDIIRAINGEAVESFRDLSSKIRSMEPGAEVSLKIDRNGTEQTITGELGEKTDSFSFSMPDPESFRFHIDGLPDGKSFDFDFEGLSETEREKLREEMDRLREEMHKLREDLGRDLQSETRIIIESRKLTEEEKSLLKEKGVKGLDNELELGDLSTFPNPSNGFFRIHFDVPDQGDLEVDVHDAAGERVYQEKITGFKGRYERTLDLSDRAAGTYYLVVRQAGKAATRKLVKQ